jgi:hypothetical protein
MFKVKIDRNSNAPISPPAKGFHYVDQGNYLTLPVTKDVLTVYSDSATSCIIIVILATSKSGETTVTLAHMDSPACITALFKVIKKQANSSLQIYAQGANPPDNKASKDNAKQFKVEIKALGKKVIEQSLFLLEGDPRKKNRGDFGFRLKSDGNAIVGSQPYTLALTDRDPSCGGQSVYCIMRRQEQPPIQIRNSGVPFTHPELVELSAIAIEYRKDKSDPTTAFTNIVNMQNTDILNSWSTTPEYEAAWFSDQLKQGACFALSMSPVVNLSKLYLVPDTKSTYARLGKALARKK